MKNHVGLISILILMLTWCAGQANIWYVHPDSTLNSIQAGLDSSSDNDTVLVGPGIYYENIVWPNTQGIDLISEYGPDTTIIDGNSAGSVLTIANGIDTSTVISGFTVRNGSAYDGSGILCSNHSAPRICGNIITSNYGGAGIACTDSSSPVITDNFISNNMSTYGGGIVAMDYSSPVIADNSITSNSAYFGGGIFCMESSPTITGNTISYNEYVTAENIDMGMDYSKKAFNGIDFRRPPPLGGGICLLSSASLIDGNIIIGNSAIGGGGGICCISSSPTIRNNTISENISPWSYGGGGVYIAGDSVLFINNIVTANVAAFGSGICCEYTSVIIDSCTISGNDREGIYINHCATIINYTNITDNKGYGVRNDWPGIIVNAEYNWWGDSTGPYHPVTNPGGLGDSVSDYVDYVPWLYWPVGIQEHKLPEPIVPVLQINPNPFRDRTDITYYTRQNAQRTELKIYDISGRLVRNLAHTSTHALCPAHIFWYGDDNAGRKLPGGVYFLKFEHGDHRETRKLLLVR